jgi:hypothetical protein
VTDWLDPVRAALTERPGAWFVRDDDAGWEPAALGRFVDRCARSDVVPDLAVIPESVDDAQVATLRAWRRDGVVRLHQHGLRHVDHQPAGRRCEFGDARDAATQAADVVRGQQRLRSHFGADLDPAFTPPWNRCTADTGGALVAAGIRVLSRDSTAPPLGRPDLLEIPIHADWSGLVRRTGGLDELGRAIASTVVSDAWGLMFHHAVTTEDELERIGELLDAVTSAWGTATTLMALADTGVHPHRVPGTMGG